MTNLPAASPCGNAAFAKTSEVGVGTKLIADGGFTCLDEGDVVTVGLNGDGDLVVPCSAGTHCLDGQLDDGDQYVGFTLAPAARSA